MIDLTWLPAINRKRREKFFQASFRCLAGQLYEAIRILKVFIDKDLLS